ncbi:hypothetical protein ACFWJ4_03550 [Kitasatospora sp. NPDC127067]|uniref:hypothetical protein n=1 Tax=Kitasatospora sp. NPDC127067 TaxID=3347126 RepID=UPI003669E3B2
MGFSHVDAVMAVPDKPRQFWFFSGRNYKRIEIEVKSAHPYGDKLISEGTIKSDWPSLSDFTTVDAIVKVPDGSNEYWVFSGDQFVRINVNDGEPHEDKKTYGPAPLSEWASLTRN